MVNVTTDQSIVHKHQWIIQLPQKTFDTGRNITPLNLKKQPPKQDHEAEKERDKAI